MTTRSRLLAIALLSACFPALAQPPASSSGQDKEPKETRVEKRQQVQKEVDEAIGAIRDYTVEQRKEAADRARTALAAADRRLDAMQVQASERWSAMSAANRRNTQELLADLRRRRTEVAEWTGSMRHSSREAWNEAKDGFIASYRDFAEAMRQAGERFEREKPAPEDKTSAEKQQEQER